MQNLELREKEKWNSYYSELPLIPEDDLTHRFNQEFAQSIRELLPEGGLTLEAGCGAGWQSLALAREGFAQPTLLDFSKQALAYAKRVFENHEVPANFREGSIAERGSPEFDLVFNAGVLEHYAFREQVDLVRGMASRSRRYILVLVPNRRCYWYWIWRNMRSTQGTWHWGKEVPVDNLDAVFSAAGIHLAGQRYLGSDWTEFFITESAHDDKQLAEHVLTIHRSPIIPMADKAYLVAALGTITREACTPKSWCLGGFLGSNETAPQETVSMLTAALSDALALRPRAAEPVAPQPQATPNQHEATPHADGPRKRQKLLIEEKRGLMRTVDAMASQVFDLQAERRALAARAEDLEKSLALVRQELSHDTFALRQLRETAPQTLPDDPPGLLRQILARQDAMAQEKHALIRTIDGIVAQASDLQAERRVLAERIAGQEAALLQSSVRAEALENQLRSLEQERMVGVRVRAEYQRQQVQISTQLEQLAASEAATTALQQELTAVQQRSAAALDYAGTLEGRLSSVTAQLEQQRRLVGVKADEANAHLTQIRKLALEIQAVRRASWSAVSRFDLALTDLLSTVRSQRAWRIMLQIRKAYTLWTQRGWKGRLAALTLPFEVFSKGQRDLNLYDIRFPSILDFVPDAVSDPDHEELQPESASKLSVARYDVLILPIFDFEFRFQRPQQMAVGIASLGHRVFWVSPSRFAPAGSTVETVPLRANIWEVRLPGERWNIYTEELAESRAKQCAEALADLYRGQQIGTAAILIQFPFWRQIGLELRNQFGGVVVYDCMDDWRNWTAEPRISRFALGEEQRLGTDADLLVATSSELHQRLERESGRKVLRLRNAADFEFFRSGTDTGLLAGINHPVIGYYGALADWVNIDLMAKVAELRPDYSFVIIGESLDTDVTALRRLPNIRMLGEKPYRMLPAYLAAFDVCLLPFMLNRLTQAVDPVKVYEYLSQGKPVVATPLPEVCDHGEVIYLASTADEFAAGVDRALREDTKQRCASRKAYASANSWMARVESLDEELRGLFPLVSILVVTHQSREYLGPFLDSVFRNTGYPRFELILVDNASDDGSVEVVEEYRKVFPQIQLIPLSTNRGFAAGNNIAAKAAQGDFLAFLNADTVVTWGWLDRLLRPFRNDSKVGMTAPVTNFSGNETRIECSYSNVAAMERFAEWVAEKEFRRTMERTMIPLLCAVVSRKAWSEVGELDEHFGLGMFEDDDLSVRFRRAGYRLLTAEDCFIHHFGNGSFAKLPSAKSLALFEKNREYYEKKWGSTWTPHQLRPGVRPVSEMERLSPGLFMQVPRASNTENTGLRLLRLHPEQVELGTAANQQPDGSSALVIECKGATPGTSIQFGDMTLQTTYGSGSLLTATLPADFSRNAGTYPVSIVNYFGESNRINFVVVPVGEHASLAQGV